jgi:flagellar motor component MotA
MSNWNDDRLDKRDEEVKEGFARLEGQIMANRQETAELRSEMQNGFAEVRSEMNQGFAEMRSTYATLTRTLLIGAVGIIAAPIGVVGALLA